MTTEFILLLGLFAFLLLGALVGPRGPTATFQSSAPRLAARIERDTSVGRVTVNGSAPFTNASTGEPTEIWVFPSNQ